MLVSGVSDEHLMRKRGTQSCLKFEARQHVLGVCVITGDHVVLLHRAEDLE